MEEAHMHPILLATDGSPAALDATREAIRLADLLGERLVAVSVEHVAVPSYGYYGYGEVYMDLLAGEHEHVQRVLAETAHLADDAGVDCEVVAGTGPVVDAICKVAREHGAHLIVVGSHGWNTVRRLVFGSVAAGVLHDAPCPVVVVRQHATSTEWERVHADAAAV
jgi:nucleotide-binding universal stress UspA family protein